MSVSCDASCSHAVCVDRRLGWALRNVGMPVDLCHTCRLPLGGRAWGRHGVWFCSIKCRDQEARR
jgi:hypothetical protein